MATPRPGYELPLLLVGAFRSVIDELHVELARHGHPHARPLHGFALQAVGPDGVSLSELGRRLGVSKQAAAKTAAGLERLGYIVREPDRSDLRATLIRRSPLGEEFLALSAVELGTIRRRWVEQIGAERVEELEDDLRQILEASPSGRIGDIPGWLRSTAGHLTRATRGG